MATPAVANKSAGNAAAPAASKAAGSATPAPAAPAAAKVAGNATPAPAAPAASKAAGNATPASENKAAGAAVAVAKEGGGGSAAKSAGATVVVQDGERSGGAPDTLVCRPSYALAAYLIVISIVTIVFAWVLPCMSNGARWIVTIIGAFILLGGVAALFMRWPSIVSTP